MIDPDKRKANSMRILQQLDVPLLQSLPVIEPAAQVQLREAPDVARRLLCLMLISDVARDSDPADCINYLHANSLYSHLSPREKAFIEGKDSSVRLRINLSWRCEAAFVLLWALGKFPELPIPEAETDLDDIYPHLPPFDENPGEYINSAKLIDKETILDQADLIYRMHWAARSTRNAIDGQNILNWEVVQEWHQAINWLTCYGDEDWDDVPTDT